MTAWGWLLLAGLFEIGFATALKLEQHDSRYVVVFLIFAILSFECLGRALKSIPLGTAYALWTGIGSIGAVVVGVFIFSESLSFGRLALLVLLIGTLIGLKLLTPQNKALQQG